MLKYHSSIKAKPSELHTVCSHSMTITSEVKKDHMTQSSFQSLQTVLFLCHILPFSPIQGHCSQFLKVRTMRNVPLSLSIPYKTAAMAKKSIWCSDVPGSCCKAPRERREMGKGFHTVLCFLIRSIRKVREKQIKSSARLGCSGKRNYRSFVFFSSSTTSKKLFKNN